MTKKQKADSYGALTSPEDAPVLGYGELPGLNQPYEGMPQGVAESPLWEYMNTGKLNGIPVEQADLGLKLDSDDMVMSAFRLERTPRSLLLYMSPDDADSSRKYDEVMARAYAGEVALVDEQKQFDTNSGRFVVWLRYDEVHYALHPRFRYLREE